MQGNSSSSLVDLRDCRDFDAVAKSRKISEVEGRRRVARRRTAGRFQE